MAINQFKEIVDKKGYKVDSKDRAIFEKEVAKSYFGMGDADTIEFMLYDSSDNLLPQGDSGDLVRYIFLDDANITKYFIFSENKSNVKTNGAREYIIDTEKLVRDAGYSNGIFKTQTTLLNRRVGSETVDKDKLWIHEISPSRTEIRVLPLKDINENTIEDLDIRLNILLKDGQFKDDTIYFVEPFIQSLKVENILKSFLMQKGTIAEGEQYIKLIQTEFKIQNWENFINTIREKLIETTKHFVGNRDTNITSLNYGKPLPTAKPIELSIVKIKEFVISSLIQIISFYLPKQDIQEDNILTKEEQITLDATKEILKSIISSNTNEASGIGNKQGVVRGCTDRNAKNYNPLATESDGSCQYNPPIDSTPIEKIKGCMDSTALNYNKFAVVDDGSCKYETKAGDPPKPPTTTKTFYVWSSDGGILFTDANGNKNTDVFGREYDSLTITYQTIESFSGDVREVPKIREVLKTALYRVYNGSYYTYNPYGYNGYDSYNGYNGYGYNGYNGYDYNNNYNHGGVSVPVFYKNSSGNQVSLDSLQPGQSVEICAVENSISSGPYIQVALIGPCNGEPSPYIPVTPSGGGGGGGFTGNTMGGGGGGGQFDTQSLQNFL
jgi:hypothetical protein